MNSQAYQPLASTSSPQNNATSPPSQFSTYLRRWRPYIILVAAASIIALLLPSQPYTALTRAARELGYTGGGNLGDQPTIAVVDTRELVNLMAKAGRDCGWYHGQPHREKTTSPYGWPLETPPDSPYFLTDADQYSLDHILATRIFSYANLVPLLSNPPPDFIFVPLLSQLWSNPWGCPDPNLHLGMAQSTQLIRQLVKQVGPTPYPRILLALSPIRSQLERDVFTPELMEEFKDSVVAVSIENALKTNTEGMNFTIDLPYPTGFHLSQNRNNSRATLSDSLLNRDRPYLLNYAASTTHPWGAPASERFNGFALRGALHKEFSAYNARTDVSTSPRILYDEIKNAMDGSQNLTMFHDHMSHSVFCPMPSGDSPTRRAFFEAILLGCIPVVFRQHAYGRLLPSSPEINDVSKYTVFIPENDLILERGQTLIERLESIPPAKVRQLQQHLYEIAPKLQWSIPEEEEWFEPEPWVIEEESLSSVPQGAKVFNLTETREKAMRGDRPTEDAFSMVLKELRFIRDGKWKLPQVEDLRPDPLDETA
ncbi:uncharacterized protein JCM6883_004230 [Sporobolomyces salmoneus]|uniref:uncharacterized protein n=1 Tax=Sporobolomyces salmoneus TaxID=183962 RepID=UPI00317A6939